MKKILFIIFFCLSAVFCFPQITLGAVMELTVNITSVQIPDRAVMMHVAGLPNTEFVFQYGIISVVKDSSGALLGQVVTSYIKKDVIATLAFPYDPASAPYKIYAEVRASPQGGDAISKADCTVIPGNSSWYSSYSPIYLSNITTQAYCPAKTYIIDRPSQPDSYRKAYMAFDPTRIVQEYVPGYGNDYYWRSAPIFIIN